MSVSKQESQAVLELIQYFSPDWTIVDVGANKGEWSDILINYRDGSTEARKYVVIMLEPNDTLRTYLSVKYDYNEQVRLWPHAAYKNSGTELDFYFWENKNSGLSSIYNNHKWEDELGEFRKIKKVKSLALHDAFFGCNEKIDIIKIDVEGAERDVIDGCIDLLKNQSVKFLQVEYSSHYQIKDYKFKDIISLVSQFGYKVWWWDGQYFIEQTVDNFVEDYRLENFIITYIEIGRYHYTQLWNNEFKKSVKNIPKFNLALEIGSFEGLTSNHICDHLLEEDGRMICIDPLTDEYLPGHPDNQIFVGQYDRFIKNTKGQPVELQRGTSRQIFPLLQAYLFDFVFVDGDHTENEVYFDGCESFKLLRNQGYILFDDYEWREETKRGIDKFLEEYKDKITILQKDYQVLIQKRWS